MLTPKRWSLIRATVVLVPSVAEAQARYAWDAPGRRKPWSIEVDNHLYGALRFTATEVRALEARMLGLNAILKAAPGVAAPVGYSAETSGWVTSTDVVPGQPGPRKLPLPSSLRFGAFGITEVTRGGKAMRDDGGETSHLIFRINRMPRSCGPERDSRRRSLDGRHGRNRRNSTGRARRGQLLSRRAWSHLGVGHTYQAAPAPGCVPIVRLNWALCNAALPRTAPQLLVIDRVAGCLDHLHPKVPGNCAANKALIETVDVSAIHAWLR